MGRGGCCWFFSIMIILLILTLCCMVPFTCGTSACLIPFLIPPLLILPWFCYEERARIFFFFFAVQQPVLFPGRVSQLRRVPWPTATGTTLMLASLRTFFYLVGYGPRS